MREFCLLDATGTVINMSMNYSGVVPGVTEFQKSRGYHWEPVESVSQEALMAYYFYNERP